MAFWIASLAAEAGLNPVECPYCRHKIKTKLGWRKLMRVIIAALKAGHTITFPTIGNIYVKKSPGRKINSPIMPGITEIGPYKSVRFSQSQYAKRAVNGKAKLPKRKKEVINVKDDDQD